MGITGIIKPLFVIQCSHCANAKAFFLETPDGSKPVDLMWEGFPTKGRVLLTKETAFLACWNCRDSLNEMVSEHGKTWL